MCKFEFGDILIGRKTNHPIIYFSDKNIHQFFGCIITHSSKYSNNIPMNNNHFKVNDESGKLYEIQFENSFVARLKLEKKNEWGPFKKVGKLTDDGKLFIKANVKYESPTTWSEYIKSFKRRRPSTI